MRGSVAIAVVTLLLTSAVPVGTVAATASSQEARTYTGAHVTFDVQSNAIVDYTVEGETLFDSVKVQSQSSAQASGLVSVDASLSSVVSIEGAGLSVAAETSASVHVKTTGSASMTAHDNIHGILVVSSGSESQYVVANLSADAIARSQSGSRVTVESGSVEGTFLVVGDGKVTVNENGDVTAKLGANSKLVFRAYPNTRNEDDRQQEKLIAEGDVAGEVYAMQQNGQLVIDTVTYTQQTTVTAEQSAENTVQVTVERAAEQGKVVITTVSKTAVGTLENIQVNVSGSAAARVSSYSALTAAIGSDKAAYMVRQRAAAQAYADVLIAFNHFSTRTATISGSESSTTTTTTTSGETTTTTATTTQTTMTTQSTEPTTTTESDGDGGDTTTGTSPGFGVLGVLGALGVALLVARRQ